MFHVRVVEVISNQGIAQIFHMDTDLMGAAGFQLKGDQAVPIFFFYQFIMGDGFFSMVKIYGALNDGAFFAGKRCCDGSCGWGEITLYDCQVFPCTRRFFVISAIMLALTRCLEITVSPEVSRSRRLLQRKIKGFP